MKKEKTVKAHTRKTKSGRTVQVKQHSAKYDSADDMAKKALQSKRGAGEELSKRKQEKPVSKTTDTPFTISQEDFKAWYNWDGSRGKGNEAAIRAEKAMKDQMGAKQYRKFYNNVADNWTSRGANKFYKQLSVAERMKDSNRLTVHQLSDPPKEKKSPDIPPALQKRRDEAARRFEQVTADSDAQRREPFRTRNHMRELDDQKIAADARKRAMESPKVTGWTERDGVPIAQYNKVERRKKERSNFTAASLRKEGWTLTRIDGKTVKGPRLVGRWTSPDGSRTVRMYSTGVGGRTSFKEVKKK